MVYKDKEEEEEGVEDEGITGAEAEDQIGDSVDLKQAHLQQGDVAYDSGNLQLAFRSRGSGVKRHNISTHPPQKNTTSCHSGNAHLLELEVLTHIHYQNFAAVASKNISTSPETSTNRST